MEQFANNAVSTLAGSISASATSLTVASATAFPTSGNFRLLIDQEILLVTGVSGATFTVTRAQEGTTAAPHSNGATCTNTLTAGALAQLKIDAGGVGPVISSPVTITIDPISGNDGNAFPGPWQTITKANSYLSNATINNVLVKLNVLSSPPLPPTDQVFAPRGLIIRGASGVLNVTGPVTLAHTGTLTAGTTTLNPTTQTRETVEDTVLGNFATFVGKRLVDTSKQFNSTNLGVWLAHAHGSGLCDTSQPFNTDLTFPIAKPYSFPPTWTITGQPVLASGDSYQIETRVVLAVGQPSTVTPDSGNFGSGGLIQFTDLALRGPADTDAIDLNALSQAPLFIRCSLTNQSVTYGTYASWSGRLPGPWFMDCYIINSTIAGGNVGNPIYVDGGVLQNVAASSITLAGDNEYITGVGLSVGAVNGNAVDQPAPGAWIGFDVDGHGTGWSQIQDATGNGGAGGGGAIYLSPYAKMMLQFGIIWGTGSTCVCILLDVGCTALVGNFTVSGGNDFAFWDKTQSLLTTAHAWNESTAVYVSPASNTTWVNLHGGTFSGAAHSVQSGAAVFYRP